ncbi:inhibin beta chain-like [Drosophila busckii]|uniref:inhibin beta chain-like n=1 Tax=Drosophila busckii TaxID=30019 RepID=UPI00083EADE5|nr:inhibin beta chain-like [Drosophila busckii]
MANMRMRFDFKPQHTVLTSSPNFPSTTDSTGSKCLYNCSCYCCLQGCCVATCCCCCCCSASFYSPTTPIQTDVKNFVRKPPFLSITVSTAHRWLVTVASILIGNIVLHKKGQSSICNPGKRVIVSSSSVSTSSTSISPTGQANASADIKLKEQHTHWQKHTSYDIANDQQLKTNNLCKMFCNNRKRQRRRRRRRRRPRRRPRRRHRSNRDTNHLGAASNRQREYQMENTQQDDIFQLSLKKDNALCFSLDSLKAMRTRNNLVSTDSTLRHCSKTKRNRANLVWLLIGLFWLEVKFINCNAVGSGSGYVSNLVAQRSCTLCQLEDHFYSNKVYLGNNISG